MNPLTSIWIRPRDTVRQSSSDDGAPLFVLIWVWGVAYAFDRAVQTPKMASLPFGLQIALPVVLGLFGGYFYFYVMGFAMDITGSWFRGKATAAEIRRALILGGIPKCASIICYPLMFAAVGMDVYLSDLPEDTPGFSSTLFYVGTIVAAVLGIWSVFTTSHALAEAQGYRSAWKAFGHLVVAFALLVLAFASFYLLAFWLARVLDV